MTLPSVTPNQQCDDDSDMFGPPRTSPPIGYHHHRSRVPMISPKLRQREERKRILQLCAHKLERIKDSETNLRRSVCINNTYCRLTDELRREKQSRYLANLPRTDSKPESARDNIFNPYNSCGIDNSNHQPSHKQLAQNNDNNSMEKTENSNCINNSTHDSCSQLGEKQISSNQSEANCQTNSPARKRPLMSSNIDNDLEILDRELSAINSPMPLIDPEITQGAEQLEKAISSRKRQRSEDESDRLVREALSQFYIPPQRLISAIDDCPLDIVNVGSLSPKRQKMGSDLELDFDLNQNQKEFEVIMDALRLGSPSPTPSVGSDSCGQAAMLSESSNVFHNLVVTSLET
ncbi:uncharacterized protein LOC119599592 [Lucilia sericata]|uniref:uncharacterized protein LOC119599592 n=1 Tax=Lucilia sericata TaxID=13632 RepID=UPI0018A874F6|nr:uncharacterized protein LOC119599592 [Lucilia sericata]